MSKGPEENNQMMRQNSEVNPFVVLKLECEDL